jgi:hypothetical protein
MKRITEKEFRVAINLIHKYLEQVQEETKIISPESVLSLTSQQIGNSLEKWQKYFPNISLRLFKALINNFPNTPMREIDINEFIRLNNIGPKTCKEFQNLIKNKNT